MIAYCSLPTSHRSRAELARYPWRWILGPFAPSSWKKRIDENHYALDNGAWSAHQKDAPFDISRFRDAVAFAGDRADWIVMPDVVGDAARTLDMAAFWYPELMQYPLLIAVQDGMEPADIDQYVSAGCGIFIGGSTDWKIETIPVWGRFGAARKCWVHCGRVNTISRIELCRAHGIDSFDGSGVTVYADHAKFLTDYLLAYSQQTRLFNPPSKMELNQIGQTQ